MGFFVSRRPFFFRHLESCATFTYGPVSKLLMGSLIRRLCTTSAKNSPLRLVCTLDACYLYCLWRVGHALQRLFRFTQRYRRRTSRTRHQLVVKSISCVLRHCLSTPGERGLGIGNRCPRGTRSYLQGGYQTATSAPVDFWPRPIDSNPKTPR